MALDIEKLRAKLNALKDPKKNSGGNKADRKTWSPDPTKTSTIRLLQYPYSEDPFVELSFHYGIGKGPGILCLKAQGKTCPVCEFGYSLYKDGDKETSKKFFAKPRFYAAMIDRSEATPIPRLWGFGKEIYTQLIEALLSDDYGTFLDPVNGLDAEIKCEKAEGADWAKSKLTFKRKESRLAATDKDAQAILSAVPTVESVFPAMTVQQINERISAWMNLSDKDGEETVKGGKQESEDSTNSADANLAGLDDAFETALKTVK